MEVCRASSLFLQSNEVQERRASLYEDYRRKNTDWSIPLNSYDFLVYSKNMLYLCRRETISNDISSKRSTTKNYPILCNFLHQ